MTNLIRSCLCFVFLPGLALAQEIPADSAQPLEEIVVVATRSPQPLSRVGVSVTVLDTAAIQASQATQISALLVQTPGISVIQNGGPGEPTTLRIRGADTDQTLVLIDGVQVNDPSQPGAGFDFADLLAGDVSRIEVLRGSQSTLWGSQAIGGVVNIVTAEPSKEFGANAAVEYGSRDTQYYRGGVGGTIDPLSFRLAGGYYTTDGISAFDEKFGGRERDPFRDTELSGRVRYDFTPDIQLDLRGYYTQGTSAFDGFDTPTFQFGDDAEYSRFYQYVGYAGLNVGLFDGALANRFAVQYTDTNRWNYDPQMQPVSETFYGFGRNIRFEYQGTWNIADGFQAVFGAQHERSTITTDSPAFEAVPMPLQAFATIDSGYGQIQAELLAGLTVTGGVRYDRHDVFGGHVTGQASAVWSLDDGDTLLRASFGPGFKAPSLYQLFSQFGNPALQPEEANSLDAGIEQHFWDGRIKVSATYFRLSSRNLIEFFDCTTPNALCAKEPFGYYANIDHALSQGAELEGTASLAEHLTLTANYTYTDPVDLSNDFPGKELPRQPRNMANASLTYVWPFDLTTIVAVRYAGRSFDDAENTIRLKSYTLVDLRASYPLRDEIELYARIENLFNTRYETAYQYGQLGRGAFFGVRAKY